MSFPNDFIEIDFLPVETAKSGDAITIRSAKDGLQFINIVDGGFTDMGSTIVDHINKYYTNQEYVDNVVLTHPDGDHALGLKFVLENHPVNALWMNRPWLYATELIHRFKNYSNVENLAKKLRECYPNVAALEEIAIENSIPIYEAFQGTQVGHFTILAPSKERFLDLVVNSEKTPESIESIEKSVSDLLQEAFAKTLKATANLIVAAWGNETFSTSGTSCENEMSVIQYANFGGSNYLLTGDAGREALAEAIAYAPHVGLMLPGIRRFQVPHHGSRRNLSTELLDQLLGPRLVGHVGQGNEAFSAYISSAKADPDHPRKSVERAIHHRGGGVFATEGQSIHTGWNKPPRAGWVPLTSRPYPDEQEE